MQGMPGLGAGGGGAGALDFLRNNPQVLLWRYLCYYIPLKCNVLCNRIQSLVYMCIMVLVLYLQLHHFQM